MRGRSHEKSRSYERLFHLLDSAQRVAQSYGIRQLAFVCHEC